MAVDFTANKTVLFAIDTPDPANPGQAAIFRIPFADLAQYKLGNLSANDVGDLANLLAASVPADEKVNGRVLDMTIAAVVIVNGIVSPNGD